ncbi:hypothetical protein [Microbulbifer sp. THAF38]|uniref:hypothetical protein n=1 Tax=Microbulbifer sp. THAF38 TaxID=2587856 RepID=UPI0012687279|nr:hypothetical protein [Microbulbifer sp. THAF38]QFT53278.1 hypothetical protein FIU95_01615 [Microbulbifer sp. THAF38]
MKNIHQPIKDIMSYYAQKLSNQKVLNILQKDSIESEDEAKDILLFLDSMCTEIAQDAQNNVVVLRQPIKTSDAEKICDVIEDYIEEIGYES